jgi:hypothetical protein
LEPEAKLSTNAHMPLMWDEVQINNELEIPDPGLPI